ncbi:MAG: sel1 repeat family protein [Lachnospiraceae bacterium]|nr:sel1 repeat family protein [Lachnospiraceae bacterium]
MNRENETKTYVKLETTYPHNLLHHLNKLMNGDLSLLKDTQKLEDLFQSTYPAETDELILIQTAGKNELFMDFFAQRNKPDWSKRVFLETSLRTLAKKLSEKDAVILLESLMFLFDWNFSMEVERTWDVSPEEQALFHEKSEIQKAQNPISHISQQQNKVHTEQTDKVSETNAAKEYSASDDSEPHTRPRPRNNRNHDRVSPRNEKAPQNDKKKPSPVKETKTTDTYRPLPKNQEQAKYFKQMNIRTRQTLKKALRDEPASQCEMGDYYAEPNTSHTDYPEALVWYQHSAKNGHYRAFFEMCKIYDSQDNKIPNRKEESIKIYTDLANRDFPSAQYILGMKYWLGDGVENNVETAVKWLRLAAEQNHIDAIRQLADIYSSRQNETMAQFWYKAGAKQGDDYCKQKSDS